MLANIRYTVQDSNRIRAGVLPDDIEVLSAILRVSDLAFTTDKKTKFSYDGVPETIVLTEFDTQSITISYIDETTILQVREWYKSVSDGTTFEIDLTGGGTYLPCIITSEGYSEPRIGDTLEYSVPFTVRWI